MNYEITVKFTLSCANWQEASDKLDKILNYNELKEFSIGFREYAEYLSNQRPSHGASERTDVQKS